MARYIAKNLVAAGLCERCQVTLAYAIGAAQPVMVEVDTFKTGTVCADDCLADAVKLVFGLTPSEIIAKLDISDTQLGYITNVSAGCGLIRCAGNIVPFENSFPRNTRLYQLMTTKPDEALRGCKPIHETTSQQGASFGSLYLF